MERTRGTRRHHGASRELRRGQDPVRRTARTVRRGARSLNEEVSGKRSFTICGPTASGKSQLADLIAEYLSDLRGYHVPVIVVDSMQVYEEIPKVTNQDRGRPAELLGVVPVSEEWTMARHRAAADAVVATTEGPFVLDAGTGMYLNALIFDLPIYRRVAPEIRKEAARLTRDAENPRRAARKRELELSGESLRGSIWEGELRYDLSLIYLRPDKSLLDDAIKRRSSRITRDGIQEATRLVERLRSGETMNPSVAQSIGVRELMAHVRGEINIREAEERISARTRQLARRQMRWFDKLSKTLRGRAAVLTIRDTSLLSLLRDPAELLSSIAPRKQQI